MKQILYIIALIIPLGVKSQDLVMKIINPQVSGNQVIYDVSTENFTDLVAIQYSIGYDTSILTYVGVQNFTFLQGFSESNVYNPSAGAIITVWLDLELLGVSLPDSTIIYQIVFEMKHGTYGSVCFSQEPVESEFAQLESILPSYTIIDDCHPDPFQIDLTTSAEELANRYGMSVYTIAHTKKIDFSLSDQEKLGFQIYNLEGKQISSFPEKVYSSGDHTLNINAPVLPGIYILTTEIRHHPVALKILFQ